VEPSPVLCPLAANTTSCAGRNKKDFSNFFNKAIARYLEDAREICKLSIGKEFTKKIIPPGEDNIVEIKREN